MSRQSEIKDLIRKHERRLHKLEGKQATFGINTPPEILTEIEDIEAEIDDLQTELSNLPETSADAKYISSQKPDKFFKKESQSPVEILVAKMGLGGTIIASVIGLIGVGITAYFGYLGVQTQIKAPIEATQTAEAKLATITHTAATPTNLPLPTPTDTLSASPTPKYKSCAFPVDTSFRPLWETHKDELGCPSGVTDTLPRIAEQEFQGGHMYWRADTDDVYIIYDRQLDGTELYFGDWQLNLDEWKWDGSYPNGVGLTPPDGLYEPIRGFGWLWRHFYGGPDGKLGWALDGERGFDDVALAQPFEQGVIFRGSDPKIYLLLDNRVVPL